MEEVDVIIVGAGMAGLNAAYELAKKNKRVLVLEARDRLGGRVYQVVNSGFSGVAEGGAEFIHGNLKHSFALLKAAKIPAIKTGGDGWRSLNGELKKEENFIEDWDLLVSKVSKVTEDIPLSVFLEENFRGDKYSGLKESVRKFVEGYDAAEVPRVSTLSMKQEWTNDDQWEQYRVEGGYGSMVDFLEQEVIRLGGRIQLSSVVTEIRWEPGKTELLCSNGTWYQSSATIITIPISLWQAADGEAGVISYSPAIPEKIAAAKKIGFGGVVKVIMEFKNAFWTEKNLTGHNMSKLGYLFSDRFIPTFWTQYPKDLPMLTAWVGGPKSVQLESSPDDTILQHVLISVSQIFHIELEKLEAMLTTYAVVNWNVDPYAKGGYSYATVETSEAKNKMMLPVEGTLFFAGEALYKSFESGTVEVALASGERAAREILGA